MIRKAKMKQSVLLTTATVFLISCSGYNHGGNGSASKQEPVVITSNPDGDGENISVVFYGGREFYYPLMAVWLEDSDGNYIQSLYVPESVAKGIFKYGKQENGQWVRGPKRAPQTLPYWSHKRGVVASDGLYMPDQETPVPDAYSGATPTSDFILNSRSDRPLKGVFRVMFELNQNWDWNDYWTNDKYPGNQYYLLSCQPALVYQVIVNTDSLRPYYKMIPVGHSDPAGETGRLFPDISTLTTAMEIADSIVVRISE